MSKENTAEVVNVQDKPYVYKDINEVPAGWRKLRGVRLSLEQINEIIGDAYSRGEYLGAEGGVAESFVPNYGKAREAFTEKNSAVNGIWVEKNKGE